MLKYWSTHTGKREVALVLLGLLIWLVMLWVSGNANAKDAAQFLAPFIFPFTAYSFGLDWWGKRNTGATDGGQ